MSGIIVTNNVICNSKYNNAIALMESGSYDEATEAFINLGDYKDAIEMISESQYVKAMSLFESGSYDEATEAFINLGDYKDAIEMVSESQYVKAMSLFESGSYDEATEAFINLGDYKDAIEMTSELQYNKAMSLFESGSYDEAKKIFTDLGNYSDSKEKIIEIFKKTFYDKFSSREIKTGDKIQFGKYTWRVLDIQSNSAMLITDEVIDEMQYYSKWNDITWKQSTIRKNLNNEFYNTFSEEEKAVIKETDIVNNKNPEYGTPGGENTKDKIFLLSVAEVNKYFASDNDRVAYFNGDPCSWWLRLSGCDQSAPYVSSDGFVTLHGDELSEYGIRPVINLEF